MRILNPINSWQATNLPGGISFANGTFSGTPTQKGTFFVPVTVSNELGSSTKNINIITRYRPGAEKFSITQNGTEIEQVSFLELQAAVQNGTAQEKYNCTNTQILIPVYTPEIQYVYFTVDENTGRTLHHFARRAASYETVAVNFCDFRNVTLQDGTTKPGLILQFDKPLWPAFAPFDTGDSASSNIFNRWRYSNLRQWLNSSGLNWFSPAYTGDALIDNSARFPLPAQETIDYYAENEYDEDGLFKARMASTSYADTNVPGFLDFLPDDLKTILQPVKITTQAFFDDNNSNSSIDDPDLVDDLDVDITYDKVFIPSLSEMGMKTPPSDYVKDFMPTGNSEGAPWAFYINKFLTSYASYGLAEGRDTIFPFVSIGNYDYTDINASLYYSDQQDQEQYSYVSNWGWSLAYDFNNITQYFPGSSSDHCFMRYKDPVLTRSASAQNTSGLWSLQTYEISGYYAFKAELDRKDALDCANPAPAFVIC